MITSLNAPFSLLHKHLGAISILTTQSIITLWFYLVYSCTKKTAHFAHHDIFHTFSRLNTHAHKDYQLDLAMMFFTLLADLTFMTRNKCIIISLVIQIN